MVAKEKVLSAIEEMPSQVDLEELFERLIFIEKVEKGLKQSMEEKGVPHEDVKKLVQEWRK